MNVRIVKIGGGVLEDKAMLDAFLSSFEQLEGNKWLVHGGGKDATKRAEQVGVDSSFIEGRRVTSPAFLDIATEVYAGVNKKLVAALASKGKMALGLSGADLQLIPSKKRNPEPIDFGMVGDPIKSTLHPQFVDFVLRSGVIPVFSALSFDPENGTLLNTNADSIAKTLAEKLADVAHVELIFAFEKAGVLIDINDPNSLIENITTSNFVELKNKGVIADGMIPKISNALAALDAGVKQVRITSFSNLSGGTIITK